MQCDLCGSEKNLVRAEVEGTDLVVCEDCAKFGNVLGPIKEEVEEVKEKVEDVIEDVKEKLHIGEEKPVEEKAEEVQEKVEEMKEDIKKRKKESMKEIEEE